jgi:CRP/FNR family transcriptional regulator, cyclic AMP receptor protein
MNIPDMQPLGQVLEQTGWYRLLPASDQELVQRTASEKFAGAGQFLMHAGDPSTHWLCVIEGLVQMYIVTPEGRETVLTCVGKGEWCGEGSLLKRERRRYHAIAVHDSRIAMIPAETFYHLRDTNIAFNHYLQDLMNARMSAFISMLEADRLLNPELRVAKCIAALCRNSAPLGVFAIDIPQHELALMCGLSRQRTNMALQILEQKGYIRVEFGGLGVNDLAGLQRLAGAEPT